ncbi:MAG: type transport system ATP-binding protein [Thermomicrobiales bacterium]|jgi:ABC-2 type transport system ATP-binding protein|nr:type transport system ATP-binding protein [Thermomicrobiales bacterium]
MATQVRQLKQRGHIEHGTPIIEIRGLVKRYGSLTAVDGVDLTVAAGEIFGILGPNGAGKTTTLEMIEGLRRPDAGAIRVGGFDAVAESDEVRRIIGVQLQTTALFDYLNATELIELFAGLYGVDGSPARIEELLGMVGLEEKRKARVDELSGGQRQRLSITLALVNQPLVAFLDEPTTGLDPGARRDLWQTIQRIRSAGTTVVLTTHYMEEAEVLCDRVAVMDRGKVIACDTPNALIRQLGTAAKVRARIAAGTLSPEELATLTGVTASAIHHGQIELHTTDVQSTLVDLLALATRNGVLLTDLRSTQASLEDVFLSLTGRTYEDEGDGEADRRTDGQADSDGRKRRRGR